jgi:putative endonuclease
MKQSKKLFGDQAEIFVAQELCKQGFTICKKNYQKPYGEIDIIAQKDDLLVFVEVKARHHEYGTMHDLITPSKQKKIGLVAKEYICRNQIENKICRFDIALVQSINNQHSLTYITDAFIVMNSTSIEPKNEINMKEITFSTFTC